MVEARWVLLDTDVWSVLYARARRTDARDERWRHLLQGRSIVVATQTRAEVLMGLAIKDVGAARRARIVAQLNATTTVPVTEDVIVAYADLSANCRRMGHALGQKINTGDRWIAATAIAIGAPVLAGDGIYKDAPGVELLGRE
ncbi:PIN domain-containing protein [Xylanimonas ulmi]|uniref:PIN domain-containing protein n=1 Tax=Xylanimonas ulmi TaxID=228973 RepID=A0A4Q7M4B9_9MICO|nr:PIN domain-containing protein [Xylanibacterium ulmi]RZS62211.1 hypothetical protein EV386_2532 [Xylanibacterium ulmi]